MTKVLNELKALALCGAVVLAVQAVNSFKAGATVPWGTAIVGMALIIIICQLSLLIKSVIPWKIPAFAWASLLALLLTTPWSPVQKLLLDTTTPITTSSVSSLILAVAGVSIGTKLGDIKKLSWKMVLVAIVVFCGTFFGSALIAQLIMTLQGII